MLKTNCELCGETLNSGLSGNKICTSVECDYHYNNSAYKYCEKCGCEMDLIDSDSYGNIRYYSCMNPKCNTTCTNSEYADEECEEGEPSLEDIESFNPDDYYWDSKFSRDKYLEK